MRASVVGLLVGSLVAGGAAQAGEISAEDVQATYRLTEAAGSPGDHGIPVYFFMESNMPLAGFSATFTYDDAVLEPESIECTVTRLDGSAPDFVLTGAGPLAGGPGEGKLGGCAFGIVADILEMEVFYVPNPREPVGVVRFAIAPDAPSGSETALTFANVDGEISIVVGAPYEPGSSFQPGVNVVIPTEFGVPPDMEGGQVGIWRAYNGKVKILGEVSLFMRGDANQDLWFNIADPIRIIEFLFARGPALACPDAADANDDGDINVGDPIACLAALFAHGAMSTPYPGMGEDLSPDALGPCYR